MTDFGRQGIQLLKGIASHDPYSVPPYNEDLMRQVISEATEHHDAIERLTEMVHEKVAAEAEDEGREQATSRGEAITTEQWERHSDFATALMVHHESVKRNKRCMLAYVMQRVDRLKAVRWKKRFLPDDIANNCCPNELEFYREYDKVLSRYMSAGDKGIGLDLTMDEEPPIGALAEELYHYRVLVNKGEMIFSFGRSDLIEGNQVQLPPDEAEPLVKEGVLRLVSYDFLGR